jgi:Uma2 family endonuclease
MTTPRELPHYTLDDYRRWEGRWELIEGIPWAMTPSPGYAHQHVSHKVAVQLEAALENCGECEALEALDWVIAEDTVVQPDNLVICHRPEGSYLTRPPVLIFEILSPSTARKDRTLKYRLYEQEGVAWYGLLDPEEKRAIIYRLEEGRYREPETTSDGTLEFDLGPCRLAFDFSRIWP